ncbi:MAG TPA: ABC transporter permease [Pseudonocardiaceae bacterium]|jgi:ABC-type nitrate/sulfonate/bicarbonate transport system permease component|nr:ABC transporter permease [Pseudonocardiaceae bacterium]
MSTLDTLISPMVAEPGKPNKRLRARRRRWTFAQRWLTFLGFVLLWQLVAALARSPFFSTPLTIVESGYQQWFSAPASHLFLTNGVYTDVLPSIGKVLGGWLVASLVGVVVGILVGLSVRAAEYTSTVFGFIRAMPPVMLIPVFLVLFKLGLQMQLATIVFGAVWPVLLNAIDGARAVDPTKMDTARVFRIGWTRRVLTVVLPAALPRIFGGIRISLAIALNLMVIAEMTGSNNGLGYQVLYDQNLFDYPKMWAGIAVIGILGYVLNRLLDLVEGKVLAWHRESMRLVEV